MIRIGVSLFIIAILLWIVYPLYFLYFDGTINENVLKASFTIGIIGAILIIISVFKDRYYEYKEDKKNNDYRKY